MISDIDIYLSAKILIDRHGSGATLEASQRADALLANGDLDGRIVWLRIKSAVKELQDNGANKTKH